MPLINLRVAHQDAEERFTENPGNQRVTHRLPLVSRPQVTLSIAPHSVLKVASAPIFYASSCFLRSASVTRQNQGWHTGPLAGSCHPWRHRRPIKTIGTSSRPKGFRCWTQGQTTGGSDGGHCSNASTGVARKADLQRNRTRRHTRIYLASPRRLIRRLTSHRTSPHAEACNIQAFERAFVLCFDAFKAGRTMITEKNIGIVEKQNLKA